VTVQTVYARTTDDPGECERRSRTAFVAEAFFDRSHKSEDQYYRAASNPCADAGIEIVAGALAVNMSPSGDLGTE
jgi:hypothetical protein